MTTIDRAAALTRLKDQVDELYDDIHGLYAHSEDGSRLEEALSTCQDDAARLRASLSRARDAVTVDARQ